MYQNLLSGAADIVSSLGVKTLVMTSGAIGTAGLIQIGNTETADEVEQNRIVLKEIADFCNANGIQVAVQAVLTNGATYGSGSTAINALVDQWATVAASVNLPICSVQDIQEISITQSVADFATLAAIEANAVSTLIREYSQSGYNMSASNLSVGDMEGGDVSTVARIAQWWNAYKFGCGGCGCRRLFFGGDGYRLVHALNSRKRLANMACGDGGHIGTCLRLQHGHERNNPRI